MLDLTKRLSTKDVAAIFGVHARTVITWVIIGRLKASRTPGGHYRFHPDDVDALLRGEPAPALIAECVPA